MSSVTVQDLLEAGVHFGHQTRRWNPKMKPYIFMERNGIYIIDLYKTAAMLEEAEKAVRKVIRQGRSVLFVGTKRQAKDIVTECAESSSMFYINERWFGGMLTNFQTIRRRADHLDDLDKMKEDGKFQLFEKKERMLMDKKAAKLDKVVCGIRKMRELPGLIFVVDTRKEHLAIKEANRLNIPVVGLVDTNSDPDPIDFPIPANDDAIRSIRLITQTLTDAITEEREMLKKKKSEEAAAQEKDSKKEAAPAKA